jgi:hypothetical protein
MSSDLGEALTALRTARSENLAASLGGLPCAIPDFPFTLDLRGLPCHLHDFLPFTLKLKLRENYIIFLLYKSMTNFRNEGANALMNMQYRNYRIMKREERAP